jgi:hypothetical protein
MMQCCHLIYDKIKVEVDMTQGPGPSLIPLTKLTLGEILSGSLNSLRRMPKTLLGIGLFSGFIVGISTVMASALVVRNGESLELPQIPNPASTINQEQLEEIITAFGPTLRIAIVTALVLFVVQTITSGMFTHIIGNAIIGKKINASESWIKTKPQLRRIIGVSLVAFLFPILALISGVSIGVALTGISSLFVFVGLGLGLVGAIYVWISLYVIVPTLVLEDTTFRGAIRRSFYLAKGNIFRVLGIGIIGFITSQAISIVVSTPFALFAQTGATQDPTTSSIFLSSMGSIVGYAFMLPFVATFTTLLYTDLRIRKENLATELNKATNQ